MTAASPPAPPPVGENGINGGVHGHMMNLSRFPPIAINPNPSGRAPPGPPQYRSYGAPILDQGPPPPHPPSSQPQQSGPPPPPHHPPHPPPHHPGPPPPAGSLPAGISSGPSQLEHIETRLRQIEHEEASRAAGRAHTLAVRKREDEEFRMVTERAEAEEEDLRRQRKRLKRESMGLAFDTQYDSPPQPAPRRLSETSAATTLAFFKQQSPPEPRPADLRPPPPPPPPPPGPPAITQQPTPMITGPIVNGTATGTFRKKQKYTIKNAEAWGERHGRPASYDPAGRALWKRSSDGRLVYLDCPAPGCGKSDFVTLHGFMCHLTKKHKDRSLGSQSRALDLCGTVYDPNAPRPQRPSLNRGSTEDSGSGSVHTEPEEMEYSSASGDEGGQGPDVIKKEDSASKPLGTSPGIVNGATSLEKPSRANGSNKPTIAAMIDSNVPPESWRTTTSPSMEVKVPREQSTGAKEESTLAIELPKKDGV